MSAALSDHLEISSWPSRGAWLLLGAVVLLLLPVPESVAVLFLEPLKLLVAQCVTLLLNVMGFPASRSGLFLTVGQYHFVVADSCAGLNTMFSLLALGCIFACVMARPRFAHNASMLLSIVPIAFATNILRVILLVLLTCYFGQDVGQGVLHEAIGIVTLLVALVLFFLLNSYLSRVTFSSVPA